MVLGRKSLSGALAIDLTGRVRCDVYIKASLRRWNGITATGFGETRRSFEKAIGRFGHLSAEVLTKAEALAYSG